MTCSVFRPSRTPEGVRATRVTGPHIRDGGSPGRPSSSTVPSPVFAPFMRQELSLSVPPSDDDDVVSAMSTGGDFSSTSVPAVRLSAFCAPDVFGVNDETAASRPRASIDCEVEIEQEFGVEGKIVFEVAIKGFSSR
mmetsp:Transcript_43394/g.80718  ORF Transcript_43394/g.80718 Transcript_43394/m.80718 type:complete len:137 (-) Transcript_43394:652-1062(-)